MTTTPRYILAPYVATPPDVVERMIHLAEVRPEDVVYDLGCGDGRLAIAASATREARSLGVDVETHWIEQSRVNAAAAGVSHLAQFEQCDAVDLDLRPASVVFLYLVHWSTQLLATALLRQCSPGSRVVSHTFPFGAVPSTKSESFVSASGQNRSIHLWVLSA